MRSLTSILVLGSTLVIGACATSSGPSENADSAESAVDSTDATSAEGAMMMSAVDGSDPASAVELSADVVAGTIAANITARFQPSSCATVTQTGPTITAVYDDCSGRYGLVHVTGELALEVSVSLDGAIRVHGTSTGLNVNGAVLNVDATATYSSRGSSRTLSVTTEGSGTGPRGRTIEHDGTYTITWDRDTQCSTLTGSWSTEIGARTRSNEVNLSRCGSACPTGSVVHSFQRGESSTSSGSSLEVEFDGTATAAWSASTGGSGTLTLRCM